MTMLNSTSATSTMNEHRAGPREWAALAVLMLPVLMVSVDNTVLSFALPEVSVALAPSATQLLWIVDIYAIMLAGLLIAMGSIGDRVGRRRMLLIGAAGFGVASVMAGLSQSPEMLIVARVLQGAFGATLMPSTLSMIRNVFTDTRDRRIAIATWAAMFSGGAALGPVLGGWLLEHFWWGSVFMINVPIIAVLMVLALALLPESRDPNPGPLDMAAIALSLTAMLPIVFAIKNVAEHGFDDVTWLAIMVGVGSGWALIRRLRRSAAPMIDLSLFSNKVFSGAIVANLLSLMGLTGFLFLGAQLLQLVMGMSPMDSAFVLLPGLLATIVAGFAAVRLVAVIPVRVLVSASFVASAIGYAVTALTSVPTVWSVGIAFAVMGIGIGMAETLTNDLMLSAVKPSKAGAAAAISETAYEIGAVLGTAVLGSVLMSTYRSNLEYPSYLDWAEREGALQTLGGTVEAARYYPNAVGQDLLNSAHKAFDLGVQYTSGAAVLLALLAAIVSWKTLKRA
jgi:DHA2 family multidrug resistance protein-like MFS transporter